MRSSILDCRQAQRESVIMCQDQYSQYLHVCCVLDSGLSCDHGHYGTDELLEIERKRGDTTLGRNVERMAEQMKTQNKEHHYGMIMMMLQQYRQEGAIPEELVVVMKKYYDVSGFMPSQRTKKIVFQAVKRGKQSKE